MLDAVTWWDVFGSLRAVAAFTGLFLAPGYCLAWCIDLLGFRARPTVERLSWAIALSFALVPLAGYEVAKLASLSLICWLAVLGTAGFAVLILRDLIARDIALGRWSRFAILAALAWTIFAVLELVDIGIGNRLYFSVTVYDHALRTAFVDSVLRTGVPPANPLYWPGYAAPMRYYYFWYVLTAAAAKLALASARQAMIASIVWAGFGLAAILVLYCRHFLGPRTEPASQQPLQSFARLPRTAIALALLAVAGLDVLPVLFKFIFRLPTDADMDWWSSERVTTWLASLLWVPHHIAGLICCLFGFLLVWLSRDRRAYDRFLCSLIAGISFASAFGLSTWVAIAFAIVLPAWMLWVLLSEPVSRPRIPVLIGSALIAALAVLPFVLELRGPSTSSTAIPSPTPAQTSIPGSAAHLLHFGIRRIIDASSLSQLPRFGRALDIAASLLLLPLGYFLEFGFFALLLVPLFRPSRLPILDEADRTALVLLIAGILVATFLRSSMTDNNDFGFRSILITQFFLLLLAIRWLEGVFGPPHPWLRRTAFAMLCLGVAGTVYQAIGLRLYLPIEEALHRPAQTDLSEYSMALRRASDQMDRSLPSNAVIQFNPQQPNQYFDFAATMEANRQIVTAFPDCDSAFGGDASVCPMIQQGIARLFPASSPPAPTADAARALCAQLGIDDLVATRWDSVWSDPAGWVWRLPAITDTGNVRILDCHLPQR